MAAGRCSSGGSGELAEQRGREVVSTATEAGQASWHICIECLDPSALQRRLPMPVLCWLQSVWACCRLGVQACSWCGQQWTRCAPWVLSHDGLPVDISGHCLRNQQSRLLRLIARQLAKAAASAPWAPPGRFRTAWKGGRRAAPSPGRPRTCRSPSYSPTTTGRIGGHGQNWHGEEAHGIGIRNTMHRATCSAFSVSSPALYV